MAIRLESLVYSPYPEVKTERGTEDKVANLLRRKIRRVRRAPIGDPRRSTKDLLFELNAARDGSIPDVGDQFQVRDLKFIMARSRLQNIGLRVMREFGLDARKAKTRHTSNGIYRFTTTEYENRTHTGLIFERTIIKVQRTRDPIHVRWFVRKMA